MLSRRQAPSQQIQPNPQRQPLFSIYAYASLNVFIVWTLHNPLKYNPCLPPQYIPGTFADICISLPDRFWYTSLDGVEFLGDLFAITLKVCSMFEKFEWMENALLVLHLCNIFITESRSFCERAVISFLFQAVRFLKKCDWSAWQWLTTSVRHSHPKFVHSARSSLYSHQPPKNNMVCWSDQPPAWFFSSDGPRK